MGALHNDVFDAALNHLDTYVEKLYICSADPGLTWANIASYALGNKASPSFTGPADGDTSGRKITVDAISDGSVTGTGTAAYWALTDDSATKILASGPLGSGQSVTSGNTFTLTAFDIEIPDPA